jgi:hypothetical protein
MHQTHLLLTPQPRRISSGPGRLPLRSLRHCLWCNTSAAGNPAALAELRGLFPGADARYCRENSALLRLVVLNGEGRMPATAAIKGEPGAEGYRLIITADGIEIIAASCRGLYYGVQTLRQIIDQSRRQGFVPCLTIEDAPLLPIRAIMLDIGRQVEKVAYVKDLMRRFSQYKINMVCLYIENKVRYRTHPLLAHPMAYTMDQVRELVAWGRKYHVDVVPGVASLGHAESYLKHPRYAHLAEAGSIYQMNPCHPGTLRLMKDMYSEWLDVMESPYFNICCDESPILGEDPRNRAAARRIGQDGIFARYVLQLHDFLAARGKTTMMWGDMLLHYPRLLKMLPKDIVLLDWDYGDLRQRNRRSTETFRQHGFPVIVCPAAATSEEFCCPGYFRYQHNIAAFIRYAQPHGILGAMTCTWEMFNNFQENCWPGFLSAAENSWSVDRVALPALRRKIAYELTGMSAPDILTVHRLLDGRVFQHRKKKLDPGYHEAVEFVNSHPFVFLTGRINSWAIQLQKQVRKALDRLAPLTRARQAHPAVPALVHAARSLNQLAWKRVLPNQVADLVYAAERIQPRDRTKAVALLNQAGNLLEHFRRDNREMIVLTTRLWNTMRHPDDSNLDTRYLDFFRYHCWSADLKLAQVTHLVRDVHQGRPLRTDRLFRGLPVLDFQYHNRSNVHVNLPHPYVYCSDNERTWTLLNNKVVLLWRGQNYRTLIMPAREKLPQFIEVVIERTHIDWDFRKYPNDFSLGVLETPGPGAQIVLDTVDYHLSSSRAFRYQVLRRYKKKCSFQLIPKKSKPT